MFTLRKIVVSNIPESEIEQMVIEILSNYLESKTIDFQMHYPFEHPNMIAQNKQGVKPIKEYLE